VRLVGVDGCRAGWVIAAAHGARVVRGFAELAADECDVVGVDMPVGLPDAWFRAADVQARAFLGPRASSIFPTPPRPLLGCDSYATANAMSKELFGKGLPAQSYQLFAKLREVDAVARSGRPRIVEIHPECSLRELSGMVLAPKRTLEGQRQRVEVLERVFGPIDLHLRGARPDDVLDAYAVLWSVRRYVTGRHRTFGDGATDRYGTVMQIVM
jgi:predicted RNase H-like nuclease